MNTDEETLQALTEELLMTSSHGELFLIYSTAIAPMIAEMGRMVDMDQARKESLETVPEDRREFIAGIFDRLNDLISWMREDDEDEDVT